eukprot:gb/GECG01014455.1/.p1 GENE.gb/GECG01014455.1/~~gb/GECG01014455.1/.p1  ORF type:complete len:304 (+),score=42.43 gb/GECG01014455.1/:1-912(+)
MGDEEVSSSTTSTDEEPWVEFLHRTPPYSFLCQVDLSFMEDNFNLYGLRQVIPHFSVALSMILDTVDDEEDIQASDYFTEAVTLYGLIHSRFILTARGMTAMTQKFENEEFGTCPRALCYDSPVLPVGFHDEPFKSAARVFCPRCRDAFKPPIASLAQLDGAFFGASFPHLLLMQKPHLAPQAPSIPYEPRVYGFKVYDGRFDVPQMGMSEASLTKQVDKARKEQARANGKLASQEGVPQSRTKLFASDDEGDSKQQEREEHDASARSKPATKKASPSRKTGRPASSGKNGSKGNKKRKTASK